MFRKLTFKGDIGTYKDVETITEKYTMMYMGLMITYNDDKHRFKYMT